MSGSNGSNRLSGRRLQARRALALQALGPMCAICRTSVNPVVHWRHPDAFQLDHRVPLSRGGPDTPDNWQIVHRRCNLSKGTKILLEERKPVILTPERDTGSDGRVLYKAVDGAGWFHTDNSCGINGICGGHSRAW